HLGAVIDRAEQRDVLLIARVGLDRESAQLRERVERLAVALHPLAMLFKQRVVNARRDAIRSRQLFGGEQRLMDIASILIRRVLMLAGVGIEPRKPQIDRLQPALRFLERRHCLASLRGMSMHRLIDEEASDHESTEAEREDHPQYRRASSRDDSKE